MAISFRCQLITLTIAVVFACSPLLGNEPSSDEAAILAEMKQYHCRDRDTGKLTRKSKRLMFSCHSHLTDAALAKLGFFADLEELSFISNEVTDAGLVHLKTLPKLRVVRINSSNVTDKGLDSLNELPALKEVMLMRTQITEKGLAKLRKLKTVKHLKLVRLKMTPEMLEGLKTLSQFESLDIGQTKFTEKERRELVKALPKLRINGH